MIFCLVDFDHTHFIQRESEWRRMTYTSITSNKFIAINMCLRLTLRCFPVLSGISGDELRDLKRRSTFIRKQILQNICFDVANYS